MLFIGDVHGLFAKYREVVDLKDENPLARWAIWESDLETNKSLRALPLKIGLFAEITMNDSSANAIHKIISVLWSYRSLRVVY